MNCDLLSGSKIFPLWKYFTTGTERRMSGSMQRQRVQSLLIHRCSVRVLDNLELRKCTLWRFAAPTFRPMSIVAKRSPISILSYTEQLCFLVCSRIIVCSSRCINTGRSLQRGVENLFIYYNILQLTQTRTPVLAGTQNCIRTGRFCWSKVLLPACP